MSESEHDGGERLASERHVLVTGGTGFVGSRLIPRLLAGGLRVTVLTRDARRVGRRLDARADAVERIEALGSRARVDQVVNLAGAGIADWPWTEARRKVLLDSRVRLTHSLHAWFARADVTAPRTLVNASAVGWYGARGDEPLDETSGPGTGFAHTLCAEWEAAAERLRDLGTRLAVVRLGIVLGGEGLLGRLQLPFRCGVGGRLGSGRQWMSWIHVEDAARLLLLALEREDLTGVLNATTPEPVTNRTFTHTLGAVLRRPTPLPVPAVVLKTLLGDMADELLLSGQRALPARALELGFEFEYPSLESALVASLHRH